MGWHAVEAVDDAVEATRRFLFPFSLVRWAKLALLVLLMGGGANAGVSVPAAPDTAGFDTMELDTVVSDLLAGTADDQLIVAVAVVAVVAIVGVVALSVASLSLRLVFYDALQTNEVRLWRPFLGRLRQAVGLFVVSALLWLIAVLPVAVAVLVGVAGEMSIGWAPVDSFAAAAGSLSIGPAVVLGLLGSVVVLIATLALRLTYEFAVPAMVVEGIGVIDGWRRVWRAISGEWAELLVYLAVHFFVRLGTAIVEGIAFVIAGSAVLVVAGSTLLLAAVPLGGLGALVSTTAGIATVVIVGIVAVASLVALTLPVSVVTQSYVIAYEVDTLGGIDPELMVLHRDIDPDSTVRD
ncbi:hypothetical protein FK85_07200 [Halorubrum saccharovorum]|uniref:Uncharacterized protein n=1 Tax=Halorubrum saccharovorum TaxID=2248 RepID=A0A081EXE7_9EURY|nr:MULTISPECIES: hypothetical protein [Halorubrum]KDS92085.1 hypothetical protein FK85_07200 [Halorubrum saccharovorum]